MHRIEQEGFIFSFDPAACGNCSGSCCRGKSGHVWVSGPEVKRIASFLGTGQVDSIGKYVRTVDNRLSLREHFVDGQHDCVFFDAHALRCSIYEARPNQCRSFPFWPYYRGREEEAMADCPGVRLKS